VVDQYPGIQILGNPCAADWNREKGVKCTEDFLQANPTGMDFLWAASNEMGLGAMLASGADRLEVARDPTVGDETVAVFTNDVTQESVERIRKQDHCRDHPGFADWGWYGGEFAVMLACGEDPPDTYDIRPRTVYAVNADQFYPDPALPPIDWAQIKADCQQ
jgi:ribose transport system substrate-binding protein